MAEYKLSKMIKVHRDAVREMALYEDVSGAQKLVTVSRDCDAKIFPIVELVLVLSWNNMKQINF